MNKPGLPARIMLIMLSLGIIAVLGASLKYRLEDHPIVMHIAPQAMRPPQQPVPHPTPGGKAACRNRAWTPWPKPCRTILNRQR